MIDVKRHFKTPPPAIKQNGDVMRNCIIVNCSASHLAKGYCNKHYRRIRKGQNPYSSSVRDYRPSIIEGSVAMLPLGMNALNGYAIIDKQLAWLDKYNWNLDAWGYPRALVGGKRVKLHHIVVGKPPHDLEVDHQDRNKKNNRRSNLRFVTSQQNSVNKVKQERSNSDYKGVFQNGSGWFARIRKDGIYHYLGQYRTQQEAAKVYNQKAKELYGEFAWVNDL